jgi:hypothetical protein
MAAMVRANHARDFMNPVAAMGRSYMANQTRSHIPNLVE